LEAANIKELISELEKQFPGMKERLLDDNGKIRRFINFYVNDEDIRFLKQDETPLSEGNEVSIIPAIAGGSSTLPAYEVGNGCYKESRTWL
jgi:molybdopterin synthase sulfur carrier subunit